MRPAVSRLNQSAAFDFAGSSPGQGIFTALVKQNQSLKPGLTRACPPA
jgi:hypothetical protein